jgi:hypothetical protein
MKIKKNKGVRSMKRSCQMLYAMHIFISSPLHAYIPEAVYETSYTAAETKQAPCMTDMELYPSNICVTNLLSSVHGL